MVDNHMLFDLPTHSGNKGETRAPQVHERQRAEHANPYASAFSCADTHVGRTLGERCGLGPSVHERLRAEHANPYGWEGPCPPEPAYDF